jgi:replicative DNA helicase
MGCSVIMEAHINKEGKRGGSMEPSGSNMWNWWPEFGIGLRLDDDAPEAMRLCVLERWRIDRVQRDWPDAIEQGGSWPWRRSA